MSIRYKLFLSFSIIIGLACGLAFFGIRGIANSGEVVIHLYDGPLMGINHARSAHATLNEARVLMQPSLADGASPETLAKFEKLVAGIEADLAVVRERVQNQDVAAALKRADDSVRAWSEPLLTTLAAPARERSNVPPSFSIAERADAAVAALDDLVQTVAAFGFDQRVQAEAMVSAVRTIMALLSAGTAAIGVILAIAFARSMSRPISAAVQIAERVAAGNYTDRIEVRRRDEPGRLLTSLAAMQASLKGRADAAQAREAMLRDALTQRDAAEASLLQHHQRLEREVAERTEALAASEMRLREAIETTPEGFVLFDADYRLVLCNAAYRALYGFTADFAKPGVPMEELMRATASRDPGLTEADIDRMVGERLAKRRLAGGNGYRSERRLADGRTIETHERRTADGGFVGWRIDVTEARQSAAAEREREKMASLGQLAGGVAHEINNLLQPALTFPELVLERLPADDVESREDLETVVASVRSARDIVRNILLYARKEDPVLGPLDLGREIRAALAFVRNVLPPGINLVEEDLWADAVVAANKTQLTQVVTNLIVNARHAMNGHGTVTVALKALQPDPGASQKLGIEPGRRYFAVTVTDDGCGMDAVTQSRIFEPFFTTKPVGEGTGLGLSVAYGILQSWAGAIGVESAVGRGTAFTLYIPAASAAAAAPDAAKGPADAGLMVA